MRESTLRWVWAHDADGNRLTEAECVSFRICDGCGNAHSTVPVDVGDPGGHGGMGTDRVVHLRPLSLFLVRVAVAGLVSSEFPPDD